MADEKFVVFSMREPKAKEIAKVIQSEKAKAILDLLAEKRRSPKEISDSLDLPMSTVQYNLDLLKEAGLIIATGRKYSPKGRNMLYYEPAKKAIVLAPGTTKQSIIMQLGDKVILPIIAAISIGAGLIAAFTTETSQFAITTAPLVDKELAGAPAAALVTATTVRPEIGILVGAILFGVLAGIYLAYRARNR
jgi:DNA-binding transcriptional ArsR family regulator